MGFVALHWILSPEQGNTASNLPVCIVDEVLLSEEYLMAKAPLHVMRQKMVIAPENIPTVAEQTIGQRSNALWSAVRKHRLTASNFGVILAAMRLNRYVSCFFNYYE